MDKPERAKQSALPVGAATTNAADCQLVVSTQALARRLTDYQPIPWELLPDLGLYMDQVITFLERHLASLHPACVEGEHILTPAMINNYVKQRVIPRPNGKKYDREHLAALLMVCTLKQVLPIDAVTQIIGAQPGGMQACYAAFCTQQSRAIARAAAMLLQGDSSALACAVDASAQCLAAEALLLQPTSKEVEECPQTEA